jgi:uridine phosphorylase
MAAISETDLILNPDGSIYHLNLLPHHITDTIIAVGDPDRVDMVSKYFDRIEFEIRKREFVTHVGYYNGQRLTVISTGIGTDNVEIVLTELDALVNIDMATREVKANRKKLNIIRIGTSGALQDDVPLGSHVVSEYAIGLDNLMSFYPLDQDDHERQIGKHIKTSVGLSFEPYVVKGSAELITRLGAEMIRGNTITCPGFYAPQGRILRTPVSYRNLLGDLNAYRYEPVDFRITNFEMETAGYYALGRLLGHEILSLNAIVANRIKKRFSSNPNAVIDALIKRVLDNL